jgi:hypothetical protein
VTTAITVMNGSVLDLDARALHLSSVAALNAENGGSFSISNAGSVALEKGAAITAVGRGIAGGTLTIDSSGLCNIGGKILASSVRIAGVGSTGGAASLSCNGIHLGDGSAIEAIGVNGPGGAIALAAGLAPITSLKGAKLRANGVGASGGMLTISSAADCSLATVIELNAAKNGSVGGKGGSATITCTGLTLANGASFDANAAGDNGDASTVGGSLSLDAQAAGLIITKGVRLRVNGTAANGGTIQISSLDSCTLSGRAMLNSVSVGPIGASGGALGAACGSVVIDHGGAEATGTLPAGSGGAITVTATTGTVQMDSSVTLKATGVGVPGGAITVSAALGCSLAAKLQVDGKETFVAGTRIGDSGGTVTLDCVGQLDLLSGAGISAGGSTGAHGGHVALTTGGALDIGKGAAVLANVKDGIGGLIAVTAGGPCQIAGSLQGRASGVTGNGGGGSLVLGCGGDVTVTGDGALDVSGPTNGVSGVLTLQTSLGAVQLEQGAVLRNNGAAQVGINAIEIGAVGMCTIGGKLQSDCARGPGIPIQITCTGVTLNSSSLVQANSAGADAGQVVVDTSGATTGQPPARCVLNGKIKVNAAVAVDRTASPPTVVPGNGGIVRLFCGTDLNVANGATIDALGAGPQSAGGLIDLHAAGGPAIINGKLKAKASGISGLISIVGINVTTTGASSLDVTGFTGGSIVLRSVQDTTVKGDVSIGKTVSARGSGSGNNMGGVIQAEGCNVTVEDAGVLRTDGKQAGANQLVAHEQLTVKGRVSAVSAITTNPQGSNLFQYRDTLMIEDLTSVTPAAQQIYDPTLTSCSPGS